LTRVHNYAEADSTSNATHDPASQAQDDLTP